MRNNLERVSTKRPVAHQMLSGNLCIISTFFLIVSWVTVTVSIYYNCCGQLTYTRPKYIQNKNICLFSYCRYSSLFFHVACERITKGELHFSSFHLEKMNEWVVTTVGQSKDCFETWKWPNTVCLFYIRAIEGGNNWISFPVCPRRRGIFSIIHILEEPNVKTIALADCKVINGPQ